MYLKYHLLSFCCNANIFSNLKNEEISILQAIKYKLTLEKELNWKY